MVEVTKMFLQCNIQLETHKWPPKFPIANSRLHKSVMLRQINCEELRNASRQ